MSNESDTLQWVEALPADDLWEGNLTDVELNGETVLLVRHLGGKVQAFQGMCPHQEVLLADGDWNEDTGVLICPGHRWEFDMRSGKGINPTDCRLREYPVQIVEDQILVGLRGEGKKPSQ
jgi:toluene monooxygenase system ferredoxin subunit